MVCEELQLKGSFRGKRRYNLRRRKAKLDSGLAFATT
jgi:hypothetical protein